MYQYLRYMFYICVNCSIGVSQFVLVRCIRQGYMFGVNHRTRSKLQNLLK